MYHPQKSIAVREDAQIRVKRSKEGQEIVELDLGEEEIKRTT